MKKILIVGDIHANYPALKAIESHVQTCRFDRIINTGDTTVYNTFPNETIEWLRKRKKSVSILGNTDRRILKILKGKKLKKPGKEEKRVMYFWTSENLFSENIKYLQSLPRQSDLTIDNVRIGVFHGTLDDENETLFPDFPENRFRELAEGSPYQIQIMGHSHTPYWKIINNVHFINPGSAGRMFDGDPRASFAIITISLKKINVEHFRISYPVEEVTRGLDKNLLPGIYKKMFCTGKKLN